MVSSDYSKHKKAYKSKSQLIIKRLFIEFDETRIMKNKINLRNKNNAFSSYLCFKVSN